MSTEQPDTRLSLIAQALADNHGESDEALSAGYLSDAKAVLRALEPHSLALAQDNERLRKAARGAIGSLKDCIHAIDGLTKTAKGGFVAAAADIAHARDTIEALDAALHPARPEQTKEN